MSLISYASSKIQALSVPFGKDAISVDDFSRFHGGVPEGKTEMKFSRSRTELFLEVICHEPAEIHDQNKANDWSIFNKGDRLEIFFGASEPEPWLIQFVVGAGGGREDNKGKFDLWDAKVEVGEGFWKANIVFSLSMFKMNNLFTRFNLCRFSEARNEYVTWSDLARIFHEVENYGLLLMDDYSRVLFAETGCYPEKELSRAEFEAEFNERLIPAQSIQHGPWVTNPSDTGMTVSFGSAGYCGAFLEYRLADAGEWTRVSFDFRDGILLRNKKHHVIHLNGLKPAAKYQYRVITLHPITVEEMVSDVFEFSTLDLSKKSFSFTAVSDLHSNIKTVQALLSGKNLDESDFLVNIGDYLACTCGEESYYNGFLDLEADWCRKNGKSLVFVRGNHEQVGTFAGLYQELLPHPAGKSYYTFRHGEAFFIALDVGNDKPDDAAGLYNNAGLQEEQRVWLKEVVKQEAYRSARWRIVLIHMPADNDTYDAAAAASLLQLLPEAELILSGHRHRYITIAPGSDVCVLKRENREISGAAKLPALTVANDTDTMLFVNVEEERLAVKVITRDGELIDTQEVRKG